MLSQDLAELYEVEIRVLNIKTIIGPNKKQDKRPGTQDSGLQDRITLEMGKPLKESRAEVDCSAVLLLCSSAGSAVLQVFI
jgi:hypothetical protein